MHPSLLIGNYDWDSARLPVSEFRDRLAAVGARTEACGLAGLIVYGDALDNAALAYLTGFTPKLGSAFAFVGPGEEVWILAHGGPAMVEAAKRLTWVDDVVAGNRLAERFDAWLAGMGAGSPRIGEVAGPRAPVGAMRPLAARLAGRGDLVDAAEAVLPLMASKRPIEIALIGDAAEILTRAVAAIDAARRGGAGNAAAIRAGEREARRLGVADVRALFSLDGGAVLQPPGGVDDSRTDPLVAYVAVRAAGYWAGGFVTLGERRSRAQAAADNALEAMIRIARPGATGRDFAAAMNAAGDGLTAHPMVRDELGTGIGLSLEEPPVLRPDGTDSIAAGGVYALQTGFADEAAGNALVSALIAVGPEETERLWPARPA